MSGPIVRKYGFPNFAQIFGKEEMKHGVDETETPVTPSKDHPAGAEKPAQKDEREPK